MTVHGKYGKTREILLHPSTVAELPATPGSGT